MAVLISAHPPRRRLKVGAAVTAFLAALPLTITGAANANTSTPPGLPFASCLPETYPNPGAPRNGSPFVPYQIPFTATLGDPDNVTNPSIGGGFLLIASPNSPFEAVLGGPISLTNNTGSITARGCGTVMLPSEVGSLSDNSLGTALNNHEDTFNHNFQFLNPINIALYLTGVPAPVLQGYASADGDLGAQIDKAPAANGGMNVEFFSSAKSTSVLTVAAVEGLVNLVGAPPALQTLLASLTNLAPDAPVPGGDCTVPIGDLRQAGVPPSDFGTVTKLSGAANTTSVHLSTRFSVPHPPLPVTSPLVGQPVTGPITSAQAVLVANDFPVAAIDPNTPPSPGLPGAAASPSTVCTQSNANLFNQLLGLPSPAGSNIFYAPGTFGVHTGA